MKILWNKKEVVILIYGYCLIEKGIYDRVSIPMVESHFVQ